MEMKKRALTMLLTSALLTAPLTACNTVGTDDTITTTETTVETISNMDTLESITSNLQNEATSDDFSNQLLEKYSTQELIEMLEISDSLASILRCEEMFYNTNEDKYMLLSDYKYAYDYISQWKTIDVTTIDMDLDGQKEMLVEGLHDIIVFREYEGKIYSYGFTFRSMNSIRNDGIFLWSEYAGNIYGAARLQFDGTTYHSIELYRVEFHGTEDAKYYIDGDSVTLDEMTAYNLPLTEKLDFYAWDKKPIENMTNQDNLFDGK